MYQRDPRAFPYDDQGSAYPTGHMSHNSDDYSATGYQQQGRSDQYYTPPQHPLGGDIHDSASYIPDQGLRRIHDKVYSSEPFGSLLPKYDALPRSYKQVPQ